MMIIYLGPESKLHMLVHHVCVTYFYALHPFHCTCLEVFWFENGTALPSCQAIGYLRLMLNVKVVCHFYISIYL